MLLSVIAFCLWQMYFSKPPYTPEPTPSTSPVVQPPDNETDPYDGYINLPKDIDFIKLLKQNPEIYAWIRITDSVIDYPIVQSEIDNAFYLDHDIDKNYSMYGSIFTENRNTKTFEDRNTVIYGHTMKNNSMFSTLINYKDKVFFDTHQEIYIYTPEKAFKYKIFASYIADDSHVLVANDFSTDEGYQNFLDKIIPLKCENYDLETEVTTADRIITLSTCYNRTAQRFLVYAVLESVLGYNEP